MEHELSLEVVICGWLIAPAGLWRSGASLSEPRRIPVPAYVIRHRQATLLVDCGLHPDAIANPTAYYSQALGPIEFEQERAIGDLVDLDDVDLLIITHLHYDHVGALPLIPENVPILVQREEWRAGGDPEAIGRNFYMPRDYQGQQREIRKLDGDLDLFGDGSVVLLSTPGHTPGHQSLRVGRQILAADVAYFASSFEDFRFPPYGDDHARQAESAKRLTRLHGEGFRLLPGHDPDLVRPGLLTV